MISDFRISPIDSWTLMYCRFKGALSGLQQILTTESLLKMMKNAFYFNSKAVFVLKVLKFLS